MNNIKTELQVSAGGVAYRKKGPTTEVVIISVGDQGRWQLPKGLIDKGEESAEAALREVREEAGLETEVVDFIDKIEYWYYSSRGGRRIRYHKMVYFYLLKYKSGRTEDHDEEVNEARWVNIAVGEDMLTFKGEKEVVAKAKELIERIG